MIETIYYFISGYFFLSMFRVFVKQDFYNYLTFSQKLLFFIIISILSLLWLPILLTSAYIISKDDDISYIEAIKYCLF